MSNQPPPIPFPLNPIFNISDWVYADSTLLTIAMADLRYLQKAGYSATGLISFNAGLTATSGAFSGSLTSSIVVAYPDNSTKVATTAYVSSAIAVVSATITGAVITYAGNSVPAGYLLCDGSAVSRITYADLFTAISTIYGVGDGSTTFNLPSLLSKYTRGQSTSSNTQFGHTNYTLSGVNLPQTTCTLANVSTYLTNIPVIFNTPNGISEWAYQKGNASGDGTANFWTPRNTSSNSNGANLISAFTAKFGQATPTPVDNLPPSVDMVILIKY